MDRSYREHGLPDYDAVSALSTENDHTYPVGKQHFSSRGLHATTTEVSSLSGFTPVGTRQPQQPRRRRSSALQFWTWEIISLFLTIGLIVAIVVILRHFEGHPLPDWRFGINLSTLVALLSTILRTLMLVAVAEALGQLKWSWFTRPAPLHDFHIFDRASRGILGSMRLLGTVKHRNILATIGSLVTILSLAIGPFTQQALVNVSCQRPVASQNSSVAIAHFMGIPHSFQGSYSRGPGAYALPNDMKGAMINGLINPTGNDSTVSPACPTGNCTFQADGHDRNITYSSIGMCSKCIDTTSLATPNVSTTPNVSATAQSNHSILWQLPNNLQVTLAITMPILNVTTNDNMSWASSVFTEDWTLHATQALANVTVFSFTREPCSNDTGTVVCPRNITNTFGAFLTQGAWDLTASSCALYPCMKNYHGDVEEGVFTERIVSTELATYNWPGSSPIQKYFPLEWTEMPMANWTALKDPCVIDGIEYSGKTNNFSDVPRVATRNFTNVHSNGSYYHAPEECVYTLSNQYVMGMYDWMTQTLFEGNCVWPDNSYLVDLAEPDCSNQFWLSPLWNTRNASFASISSAMDDFAAAVTNKFRSDGTTNWYNQDGAATDLALGTVYETTVCVYVNWEWLLMPIVLTALSTLLLGTMIIKSLREGDQQPWKTSVLPLLFYGPDHPLPDDMSYPAAAAADLNTLSAESRRTRMAFSNVPGAVGFLEKDDFGGRDVEVDSLMEMDAYQRPLS